MIPPKLMYSSHLPLKKKKKSDHKHEQTLIQMCKGVLDNSNMQHFNENF